MSNSTSAGLPTISEMVTFINNQELTLKIEDHVSMTGKTHHNLVVYFKPFHGKYYNWIRRYNGEKSVSNKWCNLSKSSFYEDFEDLHFMKGLM